MGNNAAPFEVLKKGGLLVSNLNEDIDKILLRLKTRAEKENVIWEVDDFLYIDSKITGFSMNGYVKASEVKDLVLPMFSDKGVKVISIAPNAFYRQALTSVSMPNSIKMVGYNAFRCNNLTHLKLSDNLKHIGEYAFCENKIEGLLLPDTLKTINQSAFMYNSLKYLIVPENVSIIAENAFAYNKIEKVDFFGFKVTNIMERAFAKNDIKQLTIPDSVEEMDGSAFEGNKSGKVKIAVKTKGGFFVNSKHLKTEKTYVLL